MSLRDKMKQDAQDHGMGGNSDFFKFEVSGDYRIRILTEPVALATHFFGAGVPSSVCYGQAKGCPFHGGEKLSVKYIAYVIDRQDGKIKLGELPWSVVGKVADYEEDPDFAFKDYPMPYDIKIKVDKANKDPKEIYKPMPSPKIEDLSAEEKAEFNDKLTKSTPEDYVEARKQKQLQKHKDSGIWQAEQDRRLKLKDELEESKAGHVQPDYPEQEGEIDF